MVCFQVKAEGKRMGKEKLTWVMHARRIVRGVIWGVIAWAFSYWLVFPTGIHIKRGEICFLVFVASVWVIIWRSYVPKKPKLDVEFMEWGYWELRVSDSDYVCFATRSEKGKLPRAPEPHEVDDRIYCIVEDEFWVWRSRVDPPLLRPVSP